MSLANKLSREFTSKVRDRGQKYFQYARVKILSSTPSQVDAVVHGSRDYSVRLTLGRISLAVACACPYFEKGEDCKHIWATILEADRRNFLLEANKRLTLKLDYDWAVLDEWDEIEEVEDDFDEPGSSASSKPTTMKGTPRAGKQPVPAKDPEPAWKQQFSLLTNTIREHLSVKPNEWPAGREIIYMIDPQASQTSGRLTLEIGYRERKMNGEWGKAKSQRIPVSEIPTIKDEADRRILSILSGAKEFYSYYSYSFDSLSNRCALTREQQQLLLPLMCATGRCYLKPAEKTSEMRVVELDPGPAWEFRLTLREDETTNEYALRGVLRRETEEIDASSAILAIEGLLIGPDLRAAKLKTHGAHTWRQALNNPAGFRIPANDVDDLIEQLLELPDVPTVDLSEELQFDKVQLPPTPRLIVRRPNYSSYYSPHNSRLDADLLFDYEGTALKASDARNGIYQREPRRLLMRDREAERNAFELLQPLGIKQIRSHNDTTRDLSLSSKSLPRAVRTLLDKGWKVEAEGKLYRTPGSMSMSVSSGIDWFELHGAVEFGEGLVAKLPALLNALKRGETMVQLGDGSFGLLPDDWLKKYGLLASLGDASEDHLRFKRTQTGVLDALIAAQPEITFDEVFGRVRDEWRNFKGIEPLSPPKTFVGTLRDYQCEGLGWFEFLQRFGFGGCLADDMGLGKTIQVLALLEARRVARAGANGKAQKKSSQSLKGPRPSLVVVPRSLVFNWEQEAARFTPNLSVLTHSGSERKKSNAHFDGYDLILTTYGTLRRDAVHFRDVEFDFVILDEAQNATGMQMKMFLTRLGVNSRAVITGDKTQIDLPNREDSGLLQVERILPGIEGIGFVYLGDADVVRHRLVRDIIRAYAEDAQG